MRFSYALNETSWNFISCNEFFVELNSTKKICDSRVCMCFVTRRNMQRAALWFMKLSADELLAATRNPH